MRRHTQRDPVLRRAAGLVARAENIDPGGDGHQWAWSENAGWINARPLGAGGPGMQVDDAAVTGWLWAENLGWVNLHCVNTASCDATAFGVVNDGHGRLSGLAWSENAGWIDFRPPFGGVILAGAPAAASGWAWGENVGWINFDTGADRVIRTSWACDEAVPAPVLQLSLAGSAETMLSWPEVPGATAYDVVRGGVAALRAAGGDFALGGVACVARRQVESSVANERTGERPPEGDAFWFLVRGVNCAGAGTYGDATAVPPGHRDAGIAASGADCP